MIPNNNLSILPFYTDISRQNHRKDYAFGEVYPLLTPHKRILPFQIIRPTANTGIFEVGLWDKDGNVIANITDEMINAGLHIRNYKASGYDVIIFPSITPITTYTPEGQHYITVKDGVNTYYSEIFTVVRDISDCLKIEYYSLDSLCFNGGRVYFQNKGELETMGGAPEGATSSTSSTTVCFLDNSAFYNKGVLKSIRVALANSGSFYLVHFRQVSLGNWEEIERHNVTGGSLGDNTIDLSGFSIQVEPLDTFGLLYNGAHFKFQSDVNGSNFVSPLLNGTYSFSSSSFPDLPDDPNNISLDYTLSSEITAYPFKFRCYLPTQLGRPKYEFEENLSSIDGYDFVEKQVSEKTFVFNFLAPEYLCDGLRIVRMMDYVQITNKGEVYDADRFLITPEWQKGGYIAGVDAEFQCDTVIKKIGKGYLPVGGGDFNDDFNNDFKK